MRTRKASEKEKEAFERLKISSTHWSNVRRLADLFYKNGASWVGLDAESKEHSKACQDHNEEMAKAGFIVTISGLRIIKK